MSFEALKEAPPAVPIIFTTAYDEYAVQAFKYNSFDYLLKPIDADELAAAIEKVGRSGRNTSDEPLRQLFEALQQGGCRYRERFLLPYRDGYKTVSVREINHIFTENKIVRLHLDDGTSESVSVSMDELERQLDPTRFFRANRQYIVCMESIRYLGNYFGGKLVLRLHHYPDAEIIVSKEKAQRLKEWIDRYLRPAITRDSYERKFRVPGFLSFVFTICTFFRCPQTALRQPISPFRKDSPFLLLKKRLILHGKSKPY